MSGRARVSLGDEDSVGAPELGVSPATVGIIGRIETVAGSATLTRANFLGEVAVGDSVRQGDVIETKADGQIGISFVDGTAVHLASDSRIVLKEFAWDEVSPSALFNVTRGSFSFTAGQLAKAGRLGIDTPVASIRGRTQTGGIGILSLAALYFAVLKEAEAASSNATLLDDGVITYKDLAHGVFELTTKEATPRHIVVDDPGETVVLRRIGTSISVDHVTNSVTDMARLQADQQAALRTFSLGLQQGPTTTGPGGSGTPPGLLFPTIPINYAPQPYIPPQNFLNNNGGTGGNDKAPPPPPSPAYIPPPPPPSLPQGATIVVELPSLTGGNTPDTATPPPLPISATFASAGAPTFVWSAGSLTSGQQAALTAETTLTTTINAGSVDFSFSAPDKTFDFLAANETLTITYNVTVTGTNGVTSNQPVSVTVVGTNDAPMLSVSGPQNNTELAGKTGDAALDTVAGALSFADVDITNTHTVTKSFASAVWSGGATLPSGLSAVLGTALSTVLIDSAGSGSGSIGYTFSAPDKTFDFLAAGETLTITYNVTVTDNDGISSTQPVTIIITGTNDSPAITSSVLTGPIGEIVGTTGAATPDTATGIAFFTDVDLNDTHVSGSTLVSAVWSGGATLPGGLSAVLASALSTTLSDSTGSGSGAIGFTFTAPDKTFDFLAAGETLTVTYDVTVTDNNNVSSTKPVTITITGTNDAPVLNVDTSGPHPITELAGKTGDTIDLDSASGTLSFTDVDLNDTHIVSNSLTTATWSGGATLPGGLSAVLASALSTTLTDSTGLGAGVIGFTFTAPDKTFDFLAAGETLTVTYDVTVTDNNNVSSTKPVTVTITGTNDAPVLNVDISGTHPITERAGKTGDFLDLDSASGTLSFTDVDLNDTHTVAKSLASVVWSGGATLPGGLSTVLGAALSTTLSDSTGSGSGAVGFTFTAPDKTFDFLAAGETLTVTYDVTVIDNNNVSSTKPITVTITGTNDAPTITSSVQSGPITEIAGATGSTAPDIASGVVSFADVDLNDTHTVTKSVASAIWSGGATLPSGLSTTLGASLSTVLADSTGSGSGAVAFLFSAPDKTFDFLAAGETLNVTYNLTVKDNNNVSATQPITVIITGTNDAPVVTASVLKDPVKEIAGVTGSTTPDTASGAVLFTDVDLNDTHTVAKSLASVVWSGGATLPSGLSTMLGAALSTTLLDSTGSGSGGVAFTFSAPDKTFDFLAAGQTLVVTYNVTVTDNHGASSTQPLTITILGTDDAPVLSLDHSYNVQDQFDWASYGLNTGSVSWATNWFESNDPWFFPATTGSIQIVGSFGGTLRFAGDHDFIQRTANLTGASSATLSFDYLRSGLDSEDVIQVQVSTDGIHFHTIGSVQGPANDSAFHLASFDITNYISAQTTVRLAETSLGNGETIYIDNVNIAYTADGPVYFANGAPVAITGAGDLITDVDNTTMQSATITIVNHQAHDLLSVNGLLPFGLSASGYNAATGTLTIWGTASLAAYETALHEITFSNTSSNPNDADRTVSIVVNDGILDSNAVTTTIHVDPPGSNNNAGVNTSQGTPGVVAGTSLVSGSITFSDANPADTHSATVAADAAGYLGAMTLDDPAHNGSHVTEPSGNTPGSVAWHFNLLPGQIDTIPANGVVTQSYDLTIADNHGGATTQTISVSIGGAGNDNFIFSASHHLGADTIANFSTSSDTIELDGYQSLTQANLAAAITSTGADASHGDAVINLGHGDTITVAGVTEAYLQQHLALIHLNSGLV
ncbi:MAG TPA: VCBS domain-containing protein [Pseudolabrys sp.]|nr:VCBS domain-containing protein [Pseudolabrys sp.]